MARPKKDTELCAERRILDAFWHVLESTPLRCVSVRTVAQAAEVNRGTFYYHFKSVDALGRQGDRKRAARTAFHRA